MSELHNGMSPDQTVQFMIAEYEALRDSRNTILETIDRRVNYFLTAVSGATVALTLIGQLSGMSESFLFSSLIVLSLLFLLGTFLFLRAVEIHIANYVYVRGMNRVRRYFVDSAPDLKRYLILPVSDDVPAFNTVGFFLSKAPSRIIDLTSMIAAISSFIASVAVTGGAALYFSLPTSVSLSIGLLVFIVVFSIYRVYENGRLRRAERATPVEFPSVTPPGAR